MRHSVNRFILAGYALCAAGLLTAQQPAGKQQGAMRTANKAIDRVNLDTTCVACGDFYSYANGGWLKKSAIPAAYPEWSAFYELPDKNEAVVHDVIEASAKEA